MPRYSVGDAQPLDESTTSRATAALAAWMDAHAGAMLAAAAVAAAFAAPLAVVLVGAVSFGALARSSRETLSAQPPYGGYANHVTALRLLIVLAAAVLMRTLPAPWFALLLAINVILDVVDGRLARRLKQQSELGTVFDREVDAIFVLVVCLYFYLVENVAGWILIPGVLPYVYRFAARMAVTGTGPERRERCATIVAGANYVLLLSALLLPDSIRTIVLGLSVALLVFSFAVSFGNRLRDDRPAA